MVDRQPVILSSDKFEFYDYICLMYDVMGRFNRPSLWFSNTFLEGKFFLKPHIHELLTSMGVDYTITYCDGNITTPPDRLTIMVDKDPMLIKLTI